MKKFFHFLLNISLIMSIWILSGNVHAENKNWETIKRDTSEAKQIAKGEEIEIMTFPSQIIISTTRPTKIEIFTILGRLVSEENLNPGTYQFTLNVHGVYIVKAGDMTCKVAI